MKTIEYANNEIIVNKSKFITIIKHVKNIEEINDFLILLNKNYKDSTHICYAYIIDNCKKYNDDSEPNGTAGLPILNVLEKNNLNYIICCVVRYFGGIKLGKSRLLRAYSNSVVECINKSTIKEVIDCYKILLKIDYSDIKKMDEFLKNYKIIYKEFNDKIIYEVLIPCDEYNNFKYKNEILSKIKTTK